MDRVTRTRVLLDALPRVAGDDAETAGRLLRVLFAQPAADLQKERAALTAASEDSQAPLRRRAGYGGLISADGNPDAAWKAAQGRGGLVELLRSVPYLPAGEARARLFEPAAAIVKETTDVDLRRAALAAVGSTRQDEAAFRLLASYATPSADAADRDAAIRALNQLPRNAWPADGIDPLVRALVETVSKTESTRRTDPATLEAIQLAEKLAESLPAEARRTARRDLRALGVQVVRIETVPEQMMFDLRWFAVEAGKPVQIVLYNRDAMAHNLLVTKPGALKEVGMAANVMAPPTDPSVKPYVPNTPLVLQATRLLNWDETERLNFLAPREPGEYPFVCTFPGHWVRMYGVMLVVPDLEAWEGAQTVPTDPMTNQPFAARRN